MTNDVRRQWTGPPPREANHRQRVSLAGVSGGVGTSTLATAIDGIDRGVFVGRPVDVLVCRGTADSLQRAGQAAQLQSESTGRRPVLAVTATEPGSLSRAVSARLRLTSSFTARVVTIPLVTRWRDSTAHLHDARLVLSTPSSALPRALRAYARAALDVQRQFGSAPATAGNRAGRPQVASARTPERAP